MLNIILSLILLWLFSWCFVKIDNGIDLLIEFICKKLNKKEKITRSFNVFEDLKNPPLREFYLKIYRFFLHISEFPENAYYETKYFIQRGKKGYSQRDVWAIDYYLMEIIPSMVKDLKSSLHGTPMACYPNNCEKDKHGNPTDKEDDKAKKKWIQILDSIILTFEIAKQIENNHWRYQESIKYSEKLATQSRKFTKELRDHKPSLFKDPDPNWGYTMTKEECEVYEKGWTNFRKFFFNLWN